ncbi:MAG: type I restriction endonuclease subunit R [Clostridia bacterium]|nr:type I restriction endonuclease subunit R [Clostridia bacterium]
MSQYNMVLSTSEATVVSKYEPQSARSDAYQSEAELEKAFIKMLTEQGYQYLDISCQSALIENLRVQIEKLNNYKFSDKEWKYFFENQIANPNEHIVEKTRRIQEDYIQVLKRDDGTSKNIYLIDKKNIHNNFLQVINQYTEDSGTHDNRYDVTILVNGLPLIHVELKRRGRPLREAFNQIDRYQRESFWAGCGLYEYIQLFVISNGTHTKYYSNTTRDLHVKERTSSRNKKKTSNSFEFTSFWADADNRTIPDLVDFTKTFFAKHTILSILTKYCVFTSESLLLVMRPYQIVATEKIISKIITSTNYKQTGTIDAGGYIWHTTGSGKTLTSFKTAQLATALPFIDKVLFVVDRKDLDYQTIKEYDRFEKGAANGNRNTAVLQKQLEDDSARIIVTTIQKLDIFITKNPDHPIRDKHVVLIFDECHRSQFGEMHTRIVGGTVKKGEKVIKFNKFFKNYHIFGFTGTPIFSENASSGGIPDLKTTEQAFGQKLHTYTIVDAINDKNVLPFRIDFVDTLKRKDGIRDRQVNAIDTEEAMQSPERIKGIVSYIIDNFDRHTKRNQFYMAKGKRLNGFNSIFAVSSIPVAKKYYYEFKKQLEEKQRDLKIATIFSYGANEEDGTNGLLADESFDTDMLDVTSREFLDNAIDDYNKLFKTNYDTSSKGFQDYYKDLSLKVKEREVDILIVVNMFLTGFDATTLNTLWVDKNLRQHGLIQAFSRTNRILNAVKSFGNIVCFRDLEQETNEAVSLFGDKNASGLVLLKSFEDYYFGYDENGKHVKGYEERIAELLQKYPLGREICGEKNQKDFVVLFGNILRLRNILSVFDKFIGNEILSPFDVQDYTSLYLDIKDDFTIKVEKESIRDDVVFELELVKQVEVNIDYILMLVAKYHDSNCTDKEIIGSIDKAIRSSIELRSKKELIEAFIDTVNVNTDVRNDWKKFVGEQKEKEIDEVIAEHRLKPEETKVFIENAFCDGGIKTTGTDIDKILPAMSLFGGAGNNRAQKKKAVLERLQKFFEKYSGLI